MVLKVRICFSF